MQDSRSTSFARTLLGSNFGGLLLEQFFCRHCAAFPAFPGARAEGITSGCKRCAKPSPGHFRALSNHDKKSQTIDQIPKTPPNIVLLSPPNQHRLKIAHWTQALLPLTEAGTAEKEKTETLETRER